MAVKTITEDSAGLPAGGTSRSTVPAAPAAAPARTPRAYVIGMPIASAGLWMAVVGIIGAVLVTRIKGVK